MPVVIGVSDRPFSVTIGNVDGDDAADLVTANSNSDDIGVILGNGDGTFQTPLTYPVGVLPWAVGGGDLNADDVSVLLHR